MKRLSAILFAILIVGLIFPCVLFSLEEISDNELGKVSAQFAEIPGWVQFFAGPALEIYDLSGWAPFAARPVSETGEAGSLAQSGIAPVAGSAQAAGAFSAVIYEAPTLGGSLLIGVGL